MREKPYADLGIYIMADKAIMPTTADTTSMWSCEIEPVEVFDYRNRAEFISACKRAISRGIPKTQMPSDEQVLWDEQGPAMKNPVPFKYANVSDWDTLEKETISVQVECYPSGFVVTCFGRAKNGKWSDEKVVDSILKPEIGIEGVVDVILEHLKTRTDLPGMMLDFNQPKTAKGA